MIKEARLRREILISYKALKHSVINFSEGRKFYFNGKNSYHHQGIGEREKKNQGTQEVTKKQHGLWSHMNSYPHGPHPKRKRAEASKKEEGRRRRAAVTGTGSSRHRRRKESLLQCTRPGLRCLP